MKKFRIITLMLFLTFIFVGCGKENGNYLKDLTYSDFHKKVENAETFFVVLVQDGCPHCEEFAPKLEEILTEYEVVGYKLNVSTLTEEEYNAFSLKFGDNGTPTTIFLTEGKEISKMQRISGNASKSKVISKLKGNGYIK